MSKSKQKKVRVTRESGKHKLPAFPEALANNLLLQSGFAEGKEAYIKYSNGKLQVRFEKHFE